MAESHVLPLRVYYEDTDAAGMVYYANYLRFAERGRTEMLRAHGLDHKRLLAEDGIVFAVRACQLEFLSPARLDDRLDVVTRITTLRGASIDLEQLVRRGETALVRLGVKIACVGRDGRPARVPRVVARALAPVTVTPSLSRKIGPNGKREADG